MVGFREKKSSNKTLRELKDVGRVHTLGLLNVGDKRSVPIHLHSAGLLECEGNLGSSGGCPIESRKTLPAKDSISPAFVKRCGDGIMSQLKYQKRF